MSSPLPSRLAGAAATLTAAALMTAGLAACGHAGAPPAAKYSEPHGVMPVPGPAHSQSLALSQQITRPFHRPLKKPNLLMITVDDAAWADMASMKTLQKTLVAHGTTFADGLSPTPMCVPARASLLTGQYAPNHGAHTISGDFGGYASFKPRQAHTLPVWLQKAGYDTYFIGKYLNGYGESGTEGDVPPGWTSWNASVDPTTYSFVDEEFNQNGTVRTLPGYITDVDRRLSTSLIRKAASRHKPWYMWVNYVAPHEGGGVERTDPAPGCTPTGKRFGTTRPAPVDEGTRPHIQLPHTPDMFEKDVSDKVIVAQTHTIVTAHCKEVYRYAHEQRVEALQDVDRSLAATLKTLRRTHQLRRTEIVFTSDNGFALGEHNLTGKLWYFSTILGVPMYMMGPGVPAGKRIHLPVSNADWAPTFAALAGARITGLAPDGSNIFPYLRTRVDQRIIPITGWGPTHGRSPMYHGITVGNWVYVRAGAHKGLDEAYDRTIDPYELNNIARDPRFTKQINRLRRLLTTYTNCAGPTCSHAFYR